MAPAVAAIWKYCYEASEMIKLEVPVLTSQRLEEEVELLEEESRREVEEEQHWEEEEEERQQRAGDGLVVS